MSDIKLTDDQAKRLLRAIYEQPDDLDIYDPGVVPEDEPEDQILVDSGILPYLIDAAKNTPVSTNWKDELEAIGEPDEPDDVSPALEHHTAAMLHILELKGADPNLLETTGYQIRQLWKMVLRTIDHA